MQELERFTAGQLEDNFNRSTPETEATIHTITLPDEPDTPFDIQHGLSHGVASGIRVVVLQASEPLLIYSKPTDKAGPDFVRLRSTAYGGKVRLKVFRDEGNTDEFPPQNDMAFHIAGEVSADDIVADTFYGDRVGGVDPANDPPVNKVHAYSYYTGSPASTTPTRFAYGATLSGNTVVLTDGHYAPGTDGALDLGYQGFLDNHRWRDLYLTRNAIIGGAIYERGRNTVPMGEWQNVTFSAGNFTGNGAMTWTVTAPQVPTNRYTLIGKTMVWDVMVAASTIGGTPNTTLQIAMPTGLAAASNSHYTAVAYANDAGTLVPAYVQVLSSSSIAILKTSTSNWTAGTNYVYFQITLSLT